MDLFGVGLQIAIPVTLVLSLLIAHRLDRDVELGRRMRARLVLGIPWGTLLSIVLVTSLYLVIQRGYWHPDDPLTIPFTSWSYFYPFGMITAPFAHQSLGHLVGNVIGFATFGSVSEYAYSHFPTGRGETAFGTWRSNPFFRAFLVVPGVIFIVGLLTSVFAWGPLIGFSGVVFATAGFALVRYPATTIVALVVEEFIRTLYLSVQNPIVYASAGPSFGPPWWAGVAIQGHLLGFLLGVILGVALMTRRRDTARPTALRLWFATVVIGSALTLWALWWYEGTDTFVLYRGPGIILLAALGVLVVISVRASDATLIEGITRRNVAFALLTLPVLTMAFVAIPINATTVNPEPLPGEPIQIDDYSITYAEDVPDRRVPAIEIPFRNTTTQLNSSGVIVYNPDRHLWTEEISRGKLAHSGRASFSVGGLTWRKSVEAKRTGWKVSGGGTAYRIYLRQGDENWSSVYASEPVQAGPTIGGRNVTVEPTNEAVYLNVTRNNRSLEIAQIPEVNQSATLGGLNVTRGEEEITVRHNETRVTILQRETYQ